MAQYTPVGVEYLGFADEADVFAVFDHRQVPRAGYVEFFITDSMLSPISIFAGGVLMNLLTNMRR